MHANICVNYYIPNVCYQYEFFVSRDMSISCGEHTPRVTSTYQGVSFVRWFTFSSVLDDELGDLSRGQLCWSDVLREEWRLK